MEKMENFRFTLPSFLLANNVSMFVTGWILAKQQEGKKINESAAEVQNFLGMDEDNFSLESILMIYSRTRESLTDFNRYDTVFKERNLKSLRPSKAKSPKQELSNTEKTESYIRTLFDK
jgi:hypothetical protein